MLGLLIMYLSPVRNKLVEIAQLLKEPAQPTIQEMPTTKETVSLSPQESERGVETKAKEAADTLELTALTKRKEGLTQKKKAEEKDDIRLAEQEF